MNTKKVKLKKSLGQNFLKNKLLAEKITTYVDCANKVLLEIGPGNGVLTEFLFKKKYNAYHVVELDEHWAIVIKERYKDNDFFAVFHKSILDHTLTKDETYSIVGNIPYNITFPILMKIIDSYESVASAVIMMQEEVAQKLVKKSGSDYGPISILMQIFFDITLLDFVAPYEFIPQPAVNSRVIKFQKKENSLLAFIHLAQFKKFLSYFFVYPRKKIKSQNIPEQILVHLPDDLKNKRAQELSPATFVQLFFECNQFKI